MSYGSSNDVFYNVNPLSEGSEGLQTSPFVSGDFYREPDNICRGVTIPTTDISVPGPPSFKGFVDGDYYREPDTICQGLSIPGGFSSFPGLEPPGFGEFSKIGLEVNEPKCSSSVLLPSQDAHMSEPFMEGAIPPDAPTDSFFTLELTTVFVSSDAPFQIGNHMLGFFNEMSAVLIKVRHKKFSIKADVFASAAMCTLKARVYNQQNGQYAIEFQRRSGDTLAFNDTFSKAKEYLKARLVFAAHSAQVETRPTSFASPPLPSELMGSIEADITAVLDLCDVSGAPFLQAEAATTLHKLTVEGNNSIYTPRAFQSIRNLLQTSSTDVAYPTASLLFNLAQQEQAAPLFASEGMLTHLLEVVQRSELSFQVRLLLWQALSTAVQKQSKVTVGNTAAQELIVAFDVALQDMRLRNFSQELINSVEKAQSALQC